MMPPTLVHAVSIGSSPVIALCDHCASQRRAAGGPELEAVKVYAMGTGIVDLGVLAGCCHDCGGGYCLCRGRLPCERCPRKNSPVIVERLRVFCVVVPLPPSTVPAPLGG